MSDATVNQTININAPRILYPAVYHPIADPSGNSPKFNVSFDAELIDSSIRRGLFRGGIAEVLPARSRIPPLVTELKADYDLMASVFERAALRNVTRDSLFREIPATIWMEVTRCSTSRFGDFDILVLRGLTIDAQHLKANLDAL